MKFRKSTIVSLLAVLIFTGCSTNSTETNQNVSHAPNGDIQEKTVSISQLPKFLDQVDTRIKEVYKEAAVNNNLLENIPCFCGCSESADHLHNGNCFIKEVKQDGSVVWDDHGTRCGTCMDIALESAKLKQDGKTTKEIRDYIDQKYKEGYAKPTPTPYPS